MAGARGPGRGGEQDREAGAATIFVVGFAIVLLALAGLVVDGGLALNARQQVADDVEQAARAGSQNLDLVALRDKGVVQINPDKARDAAAEFMQARGYSHKPGVVVQIKAETDQVTVSAKVEQPTTLLSLIFIDHFTIRAEGQARPAVGINAGTP